METFARDGLTFQVRDSGPRGGPAVVLLHGFPQDGSAYDDVVPHLVAAGLRVLVPDQRGYSPAARPLARRAYALPELTADVLALLDQAGAPRAHVVGHDWGGGVAWALAGRHAARVLSLTALSTPHPAAMQAAVLRSDQALRSVYMLGFQVPWLPERLLLAHDGRALRRALLASDLPPAAAERYVGRMLEPGALSGALGWYRALGTRPARAAGPDVGRAGGRTRVPTVYLHGRADPFFAPWGVAATPRFVRGGVRSVSLDAGHWLPETRPTEVADAIMSAVRGSDAARRL